MRLVDANNLEDYLRSMGRIGPAATVRVVILSGGVSNIVLRVEPSDRTPFVVKQAREKLRTAAPWYSRLDRIWRETAVMAAIRPLLPAGAIPQIVFEDRENYLFAMEAVAADHVVWKQELLAGRVRRQVALRLAEYLAAIHGGTRRNRRFESQFDDRTVFVELRVDPFYRHIARVHPDLKGPIDVLIAEMWQTRACLVHADFSPKNVLLVDAAPPADGVPNLERVPRITLVDFETGHYGDPAFDLGFFLSHLALKGVRAAAAAGGDAGGDEFFHLADEFWKHYRAQIAAADSDPAFETAGLERRTVAHLAGCALARIDGTSPVDYLPGPRERALVRRVCRRVLLEGIQELSAVYSLLTSLAQQEK